MIRSVNVQNAPDILSSFSASLSSSSSLCEPPPPPRKESSNSSSGLKLWRRHVCIYILYIYLKVFGAVEMGVISESEGKASVRSISFLSMANRVRVVRRVLTKLPTVYISRCLLQYLWVYMHTSLLLFRSDVHCSLCAGEGSLSGFTNVHFSLWNRGTGVVEAAVCTAQ